MNENIALITLSRQMALQQRMNVIANNVANMNTTGFRGERVLFEEYLSKPEPKTKLSFVHDWATYRDLTPGKMITTDNPLDLALIGDGYFVIDTPEGIRYTRNGNFMTDSQGTLMTSDGHPVLDDGDAPIFIDASERQIAVTPEGSIEGSNGQIGQLKLVRFENEEELFPTGAASYRTEAQPLPVEDVRVNQGTLELANINAVSEMTSMMNVVRSYQSASKMVERDHELRMRSIRALARNN